MRVGIIAEYNPFHNGHRYQIEQIRKKFNDSTIIAVMSGSFTQRGEPAILDKFTRAKLAIAGGCDLVLELPFVFAVRSAQDFARGSINLLKNLGIVDVLVFGAEIDDINSLQRAAEIIDTIEFNKLLHNELDNGNSYANAICKMLSKFTGIDEKILSLPNVILSVEYLRAMKYTDIKPLLIPRIISAHNDETLLSGISSASSIRKSIYSMYPSWHEISKTVSSETLFELRSTNLPSIEHLFLPIITKIICSNANELRDIYGVNEGLENSLIKAAQSTKSFDELVNSIISRRYTRTRIQRLLIYLLIGLKREFVQKSDKTNYARVLAFGKRGRETLREIKKNAQIPIITKITQHLNSRVIYQKRNILQPYQEMLIFDVISTDLLSILKQNVKLGQDFTNSPFYLSN